MHARASVNAEIPPAGLSLVARLAIVVAILGVEAMPLSYLIQGADLDGLTGWPGALHTLQHWFFRFLVAYAAVFVLLGYLGRRDEPGASLFVSCGAPIRPAIGLAHAVSILVLALLSALLYRDLRPLPFIAVTAAWHAACLAAVLSLTATMAPLPTWLRALDGMSRPALNALVPALASVLAIGWSQRLWTPAANLTFELVALMLSPVIPGLQIDQSTRTLGTARFEVEVSELCSGLEGVGLMLAFTAGWLWYFRRDYRFPRALLVVPAGIAAVFVLNALRIAVIVLMGNAGYPRAAIIGFHSQAGWIAFNLAALGTAILAKHSRWLSRVARPSPAPLPNVTASYLVPLLAILASGMLLAATGSGFDRYYPLRLAAGAVALAWFVPAYRRLDCRLSWRAPLTGAGVFLVWVALDWLSLNHRSAPAQLLAMSPPHRMLWIGCRIAAATVTVPLAEELAYRGFLMRRLVDADFERVEYRAVGPGALVASAVVFGVAHGALWPAGIVAGLAFGGLSIRTGRLAESIAAHAVANGLLATYVLFAGAWELW